LFLLVVAAFIVKPYIIAILTSAVIAYLFYPVFKWLNKKIKHKFTAAIIVTILIIILLVVPLALSVNVMSKEAYLVYLEGKQRIGGNILKNCDNYVCEMIKDWSANTQVQYYFQEALKTATNYIIDSVSQFVLGIPKLVINLFISFFVVFYLLKEGDIFIEKLKKIFQLGRHERTAIIKRLDEVMNAVIYGNVIISIILGLIGGISFWAFGVSSPLIWGILMAILAFAPYVGAAMVWIPASLIFVFDGISNDSTTLIWKGVGIFLINLIAGTAADNILRPKIIGERGRVHPVVILVGIFGGISLFGIAGFIIGPVLLAITVTLIDLYISKNNG